MRSPALAMVLSLAGAGQASGADLRFFACQRVSPASPEAARPETSTIILGGGLASVQADLFATHLFRCETTDKVVTCKRGDGDYLTFSTLHLSAIRTQHERGGEARTIAYRCRQVHE